MSLTAYRMARYHIFDAARRRQLPGQRLRDAITPDDHRALIACRLVTTLKGPLTMRVFSKMGAWR